MDLSHGHPPSLSSCSDRRNQQIFHRPSEPATPSPQSTQHYDPPFSLQNRRLQLRNIGFRATKVTSQRLGVKISRFFNGPEGPQSDPVSLRNQENSSPRNRSTHSLRTDHLPSTALGILQEISNSTRSRYSQKRSDVPIVEDNPERPLLDISAAAATPGTCYYDAASTHQSPLNFQTTNADFDNMKLREISGNERRSPRPLSSPIVRPVRGRKKQRLDPGKSTFGASEYIEHIENELQQVKEAMHSPNSGRPLQEKLKILQAENLQLKETILELEETFDERLKAAMEHKAATEVEIRRRIRELEDELVSKETTIGDLEHDRDQSKYDGGREDALRAIIDRLGQEKERLEEANRVVEKRNEALTGLLAQSPTRTHHGFELASPVRQDSRRNPRPQSMVVRKLSPPRSEHYRRPKSVQISPSRPSTGHFSSNTALQLQPDRPCGAVVEVDSQKTSDSESLDSGLGESCSVRSPARKRSRRSSAASHASTSPSTWSLPLPTSPPDGKATVKQNRHRRTRRFESGSTQLKPLLLSTMATESHAFLVYHPPNPYSSATRREISEQSLDPTISHLSQPFETPIQRPSLSTKWVSETALEALEGSPEPQYETFEDIIARHDFELAGFASSPISRRMSDHVDEQKVRKIESPAYVDDPATGNDVSALLNHQEPIVTDEEMLSNFNAEASFNDPPPSTTGSDEPDVTSPCAQLNCAGPAELQRSSNDRLDRNHTPLCQELVDSSRELMPQPLFLPGALDGIGVASTMTIRRLPPILVSGDTVDSPIPRKRQRSSDPDSCSFIMPTLCINPTHEATTHEKPLFDTYVGPFNASTDSGHKPRNGKPPSRPRNPHDASHKKTPSPMPLTSITIRTIFRTLSRYTSYVRRIRRNPTDLARRVIANAWHSNWKRLGKLSWWVLGLFLGPGPDNEQMDSANNAGWDLDQYNGEAIAEEVNDSEIEPADRNAASSRQTSPTASNPRWARFDKLDPRDRTAMAEAKTIPALKPDNQRQKKQKPSWRKSLYLWGKFSVALMLAVGGAIINGPEEMLRDCAEQASRTNAPMMDTRSVDGPQTRSPPEKQHCPATAGDIPTTETSPQTEARQTPVAKPKQQSGARNTSGGSVRSFSGAGAGTALGIVRLGRSSLKTPSPARRRRRTAVSDPRASKKYAVRSSYGNEGGDRSDENGGRNAATSRICNHSRATMPSPQADNDNEYAGALQWVQNLNIKDFRENSSQSGGPVFTASAAGEHSHL